MTRKPLRIASVNVNGVRAAFRKHVNDRIPADCTVDFHEHGSGTAVAFDTSGAVFRKTQAALTDDGARMPPSSAAVVQSRWRR